MRLSVLSAEGVGRHNSSPAADTPADLEDVLMADQEDDQDAGGNDTFFSWFFRGEGPAGFLSGAAFQKNRFRGEGSAYSTFFEDNYVWDVLGEPDAVVPSLAKALDRSIEDVNRDLRALAYARVMEVKRKTSAAASHLSRVSGGGSPIARRVFECPARPGCTGAPAPLSRRTRGAAGRCARLIRQKPTATSTPELSSRSSAVERHYVRRSGPPLDTRTSPNTFACARSGVSCFRPWLDSATASSISGFLP